MVKCDDCGKDGLLPDEAFGLSVYTRTANDGRSIEANADEELKLCRACYDKRKGNK